MELSSKLFIGKTGFEPATPCSQTKCSTKLSYFPLLSYSLFQKKCTQEDLNL